MTSSRRKNIITAIIIPLLIAAIYLIVPIYRSISGRYRFFCPFRVFAGIYCPGCGGTRSVYALMKGDIVSAMHYNAVIPFLVLAVILIWAENVAGIFGWKIKIIPNSRRFWLVTVGIIIIYFILRNFMPEIAPV